MGAVLYSVRRVGWGCYKEMGMGTELVYLLALSGSVVKELDILLSFPGSP